MLDRPEWSLDQGSMFKVVFPKEASVIGLDPSLRRALPPTSPRSGTVSPPNVQQRHAIRQPSSFSLFEFHSRSDLERNNPPKCLTSNT